MGATANVQGSRQDFQTAYITRECVEKRVWVSYFCVQVKRAKRRSGPSHQPPHQTDPSRWPTAVLYTKSFHSSEHLPEVFLSASPRLRSNHIYRSWLNSAIALRVMTKTNAYVGYYKLRKVRIKHALTRPLNVPKTTTAQGGGVTLMT